MYREDRSRPHMTIRRANYVRENIRVYMYVVCMHVCITTYLCNLLHLHPPSVYETRFLVTRKRTHTSSYRSLTLPGYEDYPSSLSSLLPPLAPLFPIFWIYFIASPFSFAFRSLVTESTRDNDVASAIYQLLALRSTRHVLSNLRGRID